MRIEVVGYLDPGADETNAVVLVNGEHIGAVRINLDDVEELPYETTATVTVVDPGRGWDGQLAEWQATERAAAATASPAAAELIHVYYQRGADTDYVTGPADDREVA